MHFLNKIHSSFTSPVYRCLTRRHMQLFVGGLSYDTNECVLKDAFKDYGEIVEVKVMCDRVSGKSRGYGFVRYASESAATKALKEMDGQLLDGRNIRIHRAHGGGSSKEAKNLLYESLSHSKCSQAVLGSYEREPLITIRWIEKMKMNDRGEHVRITRLLWTNASTSIEDCLNLHSSFLSHGV